MRLALLFGLLLVLGCAVPAKAADPLLDSIQPPGTIIIHVGDDGGGTGGGFNPGNALRNLCLTEANDQGCPYCISWEGPNAIYDNLDTGIGIGVEYGSNGFTAKAGRSVNCP